jgi:hypothetical protein
MSGLQSRDTAALQNMPRDMRAAARTMLHGIYAGDESQPVS